MIHIADLPSGDDLMAEKAAEGASSMYVEHEKKLECAINDIIKVDDFTQYKYTIVRPCGSKVNFPYAFAGTDPLRSGVLKYLTEEYENNIREEAEHMVSRTVVRYDVERMVEFGTWKKISEHALLKDALIKARHMRDTHEGIVYRVHIDFPLSIDDDPKEQF